MAFQDRMVGAGRIYGFKMTLKIIRAKKSEAFFQPFLEILFVGY